MPTVRNRPSIHLSPRRYDTVGLPTRYINPGELEAILHLYESVRPEVVIEFGVNNGRTPLAALRNIPTIKQYLGIEVEPGYLTTMPCQRREVPTVPGELALHDPRFALIVRRRGSFDLTPLDLPKCDAVFIDADHSRAGVLNDYELAKAVVKPGGVIVFHDDNCQPVVQVTETLNELCARGAAIQHVAGTWLAFERV